MMHPSSRSSLLFHKNNHNIHGYSRPGRSKWPVMSRRNLVLGSPLLILVLWTMMLLLLPSRTVLIEKQQPQQQQVMMSRRIMLRPNKRIVVVQPQVLTEPAKVLEPMQQQQHDISILQQGKIPVYSPIGDIHGVYNPIPITNSVQTVEKLPITNSVQTVDTPITNSIQTVDTPITNSVLDATVVRPRPQPQPRGATIYYYDAATLLGELPDIVYTVNGTSVDLKSLHGEIIMEPPLNLNSKQQPLFPPPAQDEYIIISTVAVMALLVGALSARRLRSKNLLSTCIENESLEDELAYDTAYTTSGGKYDTFGPWKGDLEKFDV